MRRLFIPNFDFEHQLAGRRNRSRSLRQVSEDLATVWAAIAEDGDLVYTPARVDCAFFDTLHAAGLARVEPVLDLNGISEPVEVCPWGWTDAGRTWAARRGHHVAAPPQAAIRAANSRRFSAWLEREWRIALPGAAIIQSEADLLDALRPFASDGRWVIKAEFSMSARERLLGRGRELPAQATAWIGRRLQSDGVLFFEPWLDALAEAGLQFAVPPIGGGPPILEGITPLLTDQKGQYRGSDFTPDTALAYLWADAVEVAARAAARLQQSGYFGPLGIDAMRYRTADGEVRLRALQDVNARYTMGRLSLGFRRLLRPGERGEWRHAIRSSEPADLPAGARLILTTPPEVGGRQARHAAVVVITKC